LKVLVFVFDHGSYKANRPNFYWGTCAKASYRILPLCPFPCSEQDAVFSKDQKAAGTQNKDYDATRSIYSFAMCYVRDSIDHGANRGQVERYHHGCIER